MKVIIAGSRTMSDYGTVAKAIQASGYSISEVVSGKAKGVDTAGEVWANNHDISIATFPAQWAVLGKVAGFMRNEHMADYADALIAVWDGESRGTAHMINTMRERGKPVFVYNYRIRSK
jgi:hypothetical protein